MSIELHPRDGGGGVLPHGVPRATWGLLRGPVTYDVHDLTPVLYRVAYVDGNNLPLI